MGLVAPESQYYALPKAFFFSRTAAPPSLCTSPMLPPLFPSRFRTPHATIAKPLALRNRAPYHRASRWIVVRQVRANSAVWFPRIWETRNPGDLDSFALLFDKTNSPGWSIVCRSCL